MNNDATPENAPPELDPAREKPRVSDADLDMRSRKWRRRLASIKESPIRVVLEACLIFFWVALFPTVVEVIQEGQPLSDTLREIRDRSIFMAILLAVALLLYPFVLLPHILAVIQHRRRKNNSRESRRPIELDPTQCQPVTLSPGFQKPQAQVTDGDTKV